MGQMDDELRDLLHARASHVVPAADLDLMPGIERRARALRLRRKATWAGSALAVLLVAAVLPVLVHRAKDTRADRDDTVAQGPVAPYAGPASAGVLGGDLDTPLAEHAEAADQADGASGMTGQTRTAREAGAPVSLAGRSRAVDEGDRAQSPFLAWPARGARPPRALLDASRDDLAAALRSAPDGLVTRDIWSGQLPETREWVYVLQVLPQGARTAELAVYRADNAGADARQVYRDAVCFRHPGPGEDPAAVRTALERVTLLALPLDPRWALVVGAPQAARLGYAAPGSDRFDAVRSDDGAAVVRRVDRGSDRPELFQAVAGDGTVLTPADLAAERRARVEGGRPLAGWGLDAPS